MAKDLDFSLLESEIIRVIQNTGLQAHVWFPVVRRDFLTLAVDVPDEDIHVAVVGLVRKGAIVDVETNGWRPPNWVADPEALRSALAKGSSMGRKRQQQAAIAKDEQLARNAKALDLSLLESQIIMTIDHVGWYAYLWFPIVQRELMNFGSQEREEKVHSTLVALISRGALVVTEESDEFPQWNPTELALEAALNCKFPSQIP